MWSGSSGEGVRATGPSLTILQSYSQDFLGELRKVTPAAAAARKAVEVIVLQFRNDLFNMGIVDNVKILDRDVHDGTTVETVMAEHYVQG